MLGAALGVFLGGLLLVVAVGGVWLGMREARTEGGSQAAPASAARPSQGRVVPLACLEWQERACHCADPEIVSGYCAYARNANESMARGEAGEWDCVGMRNSMYASCPTVAGTEGSAPTHPVARPATGYPECDELTRLGCSCGPEGPNRDRRCDRANAYASEVAGYGTETDEERNRQCRARQDGIRGDCQRRP